MLDLHEAGIELDKSKENCVVGFDNPKLKNYNVSRSYRGYGFEVIKYDCDSVGTRIGYAAQEFEASFLIASDILKDKAERKEEEKEPERNFSIVKVACDVQ